MDFEKIDRQTIKAYLSTLQKPEEEDPSHKWIGTYTVVTATIQKFYKWLYYPNTHPDQDSGFGRIRKREQTSYKVNDLWTMEEHAVFLKYCPSVRIKAYHAMALDTSARPHELLKLRTKDLKGNTANQRPNYTKNHKTGMHYISVHSSRKNRKQNFSTNEFNAIC